MLLLLRSAVHGGLLVPLLPTHLCGYMVLGSGKGSIRMGRCPGS